MLHDAPGGPPGLKPKRACRVERFYRSPTMPYALFYNEAKLSKAYPTEADVWKLAQQSGLVVDAISEEEKPRRARCWTMTTRSGPASRTRRKTRPGTRPRPSATPGRSRVWVREGWRLPHLTPSSRRTPGSIATGLGLTREVSATLSQSTAQRGMGPGSTAGTTAERSHLLTASRSPVRPVRKPA